ncbi:MAG: carbohydrate ABC transporter substrate-binding protein, partial [Lachnospiraceae bacterium]|nr:carbohydrate ABC transporter substrate-binding protein [Lachnospiraceae bacterium]
MKKKWIAGLLAMTMALPLTANVAYASDEEITITIPTYYVGENVGAVYFEPAVERFNEQYEGVYHIELEEVVEDTYSDKISQLAQSGNIPLLISGASTELIETVIIPNELYYPMNDFLEENPDIADLCLETSVEYCTQENGDIISIPIVTLSNMGSFYNTELYSPDKNIVDMTVDEFIESLGDNTLAFQTVDNAWTTMLFYTALIANEEGGADLLQSYDGYKLYDFNQDVFIAAAEKLQEIWAGYASSSSLGSAYADAANTFMSNGAAVIFNGSWMNSEFDEESSGDWSNDFDGANVNADYYPGNVAICNQAGYGR